METKEFSQTEFARWFFEQAQTIEHYPFDAFYDCYHIVQKMYDTFSENKQYETPENKFVEMFYAVSYMGTHIFDLIPENMDAIKLVVNNAYKGHRFFILKFYYNYSYYSKQSFVTADEYTGDEITDFLV